MADKRFRVSVNLDVEEVKNGDLSPFFSSAINYEDAPYDVVLAVEQVLIEAQQKLGDMGYEHADKKGLPKPPRPPDHAKGRGRRD